MRNNYANIEKNLKGCIKGKMSVDASLIVKFLICGTLVATLTACSGGGGNSGNSIAPIPPIGGVTPPGGGTGNENTVINESSQSITANRIAVTISKPVKVAGNDITGVIVTDMGTAINNSKIDVTGANSVGISVKDGSFAQNRGTINVTGVGSYGIFVDNNLSSSTKISSALNDAGAYIKVGDRAYGIYVKGSEVIPQRVVNTAAINKGMIDAVGTGIGIYVSSGMNALNDKDGIITVVNGNAMESNGDGSLDNEGLIKISGSGNGFKILARGTGQNYGTIEVSGDGNGMYSEGKSNIINGANALIDITGSGYGMYGKNGTIAVNDGNINVKTGIGIYSEGKNSTETVKNYGDIAVTVSGTGIYMNGGTVGTNHSEGLITYIYASDKELSVKDAAIFAIDASRINNYGKIDIASGYGMSASKLSSLATNYEGGTIVVRNNGIGMYATENAEIKNLGTIIVEDGGIGMTGGGYYYSTNAGTGEIKVLGTGIGIKSGYNVSGGKITVSGAGTGLFDGDNSGEIIVSGSGVGISNGNNISGGSITVSGSGTGVLDGDNYGKIEVLGSGVGILGTGSKAISANAVGGHIEAIGTGAIGMKATEGAKVINNGKINVYKDAFTGMYATGVGSSAVNNGYIYYEQAKGTTDNKDTLGKDIDKAAMLADNGGTITNNGTVSTVGPVLLSIENSGSIQNMGTISSDEDIKIQSDGTGAYFIGTNEDGKSGKLEAKGTVTLNSEVKVSTNIAKAGYRDEYKLYNVVTADKIETGENFAFTSTSMLYDASIKDGIINGNLDAILSRNESSLKDYSQNHLTDVAEILGKVFDDSSIYSELSADQKIVVGALFDNTENAVSLNKALLDLSGNIYSNIPRQIFDLNRTFGNEDRFLISSLDRYKFNVALLGDYTSTDSKDFIEKYSSKFAGILGGLNLGRESYLTLGYGYSDIDYERYGSGKINTIHGGIYKNLRIDEFMMRFSVNGEYNFHKVDRDIKTIGRGTSANFDSYVLTGGAEIYRRYGSEIYAEPKLGFTFGYGKFDSFSENGSSSAFLDIVSQDYLSFKPAFELKVAKEIGNEVEIYAIGGVNYELGDMDRNIKSRFKGFDGEFTLPSDRFERVTSNLKIGTSLKYKDVEFNFEIGKEFSRRDSAFGTAGIKYNF